ncbi:hypothetical protein SBRY_70011 [Actinacidiphila bryophytorum]|uniref:Uncharacterized protein n=1 Tax=Actinacidiphila bryophytorum TaxID=1436133 RepID=A0A9W4H6Y2_9ACTN|nr:hypothetical protein SBRY_70011 [Actinacidiphila bryophytorum]
MPAPTAGSAAHSLRTQVPLRGEGPQAAGRELSVPGGILDMWRGVRPTGRHYRAPIRQRSVCQRGMTP